MSEKIRVALMDDHGLCRNGSVKDMQAFANQTGNHLVSQNEENSEYIFYIQKK